VNKSTHMANQSAIKSKESSKDGMKVRFVKINYIGKIKGTDQVFDLTDEAVARKNGVFDEDAFYGPLTIVIGAGHVIPALEKSISGMKAGDKKKITVSVEEGFGKREPERVKLIPEAAFKAQGLEAKPGIIVNIGGLVGRVQNVANGRITVDFNHPLAGRELEYDVEIIEDVGNADEQLKGLLNLHLRSHSKDVSSVKITDGSNAEIESKWVLSYPQMSMLSDEFKKYVGGGDKIKTVKFVYSF